MDAKSPHREGSARSDGPDAGPRRGGRWLTVVRATPILVVLGLAWRTVRYTQDFPVWGDEAFLAINVLTRDLGGLGRPLDYDQVAPPAFLWAEWGIVQVIGGSERALRLIPYLAGVASLLLFWHFCRRVAGRRVVLLAVALFAASVYPVRHANEIKPYAVDLLVSLALTSLGWALWRDPRSSWRWLGLIGVASVGVWWSYTAVFPAAGVGLFLAWRVLHRRSAHSWAWWLAYALLSGVSWATMMIMFAAPQARSASWQPDGATWRDAFPPLSKPWLLPWWLLDVHAGNMMAYPYGGNHFGSAATLLLVALGAAALWRRRRPLLILLLGPLPVALLAAALRRYPYGTSARVALYAAPAFCLLAGVGLAAVIRALPSRWARSRGPILVAGLLGLIPVAGTIVSVLMPYKSADDIVNRRVARLLADRTAPGDRWILFNGASPPPRFPNLMLAPWMQQVAEIRFNLLRYAPVPTRWERDPGPVEPTRGGRTWLIIHYHSCQELYPHGRLADLRRNLVRRLGPPRSTRFPLTPSESIEACVFPPAP